MINTLYKHQQKVYDLNPKKYLFAHGTGTGKTITSLALAQKNDQTALISAPKALLENWGRSIIPFNKNHKIISKEVLRRDWDKLPRYNTLILDEFHFWGNLKSQMSKSLQKYIKKHNPEYIYGLTATPYCNPMNVFALATHLGYKINYYNFFNQFYYNVRMGNRMIPVIQKNKENELIDLIKKIGDVCTLEQCVDVPEQTFETIYFEQTKSQEKGIKEIDESAFITRWTRSHTILNGLKIGDEYVPDQYFECLKNDYIVSFSEENPKFAIVCRYNMQIKMLQGLLEKKGKKVFVINGDVKNRDEIIQEVEKTPECILILQADSGVGFEIPSVPIMIFASLSFSYVSYKQSIGRILRINKLKKNLYIHLVVKDSVDEDVYNCIMKKEDFYVKMSE